jgi:predicted DNA-binding antitoxin AbrB/MazE fold protein
MNSYQLPEGEDLPIEAIEAQYRAVRELRKKKKEEQEEIEDALLLEDKSDDSPYSFI